MALWLLFLGPVRTSAAEQLRAAEALNYLAEWTLTLEGGRGPVERALRIRESDGKVVVTLGGGRGRDVEITDISKQDNNLVLKYKVPGRGGGGATDAIMTLDARPDGTLKVTQTAGSATQSGTARKRCPPHCK